jgi:hypothetical protein
MTWADFAAHKYDFQDTDGKAPVSGTDISATLPLNVEDGIVNIANNLMGTDFGNALKYAMTTKSLTTAQFNTKALYSGLYKVDDYENPTKILNADGTEYVPSNLTKAKAAVLKAVDDFIAVYNSFWNQTVAKAGTEYDAYFTKVEADPSKTKDINTEREKAEKAINDLFNKDLDPKCYTLATFKPYADEAPIVTFTGADVDGTDAINAILVAVDPACTDKTDAEYFDTNAISTGAIFNGNATDFYKFMKAAYDYYTVTNETITEELAVLKAWIDGVEETFKADADKAKSDDTKAFNEWKAAYKKATDRFDALCKFTGKDKDGMPNGIVNIAGTYADPESITPDNWFELLNKNLLGDCDGWIENLGGEQLALAEKLFPEFPKVFQAWKEAKEEYNDEKTHREILMDSFKTAYYAAAKAAGYDQFNNTGKSAADWDALYKAYKEAREAYVKKLENDIVAMTSIIDDNAKKIADFWSEKPAIDIEIADAQADLTIEMRRLAALEEALAYAKVNMERVLDYVKSQDANFVLLNILEDPELGAILEALRYLGIGVPQFNK